MRQNAAARQSSEWSRAGFGDPWERLERPLARQATGNSAGYPDGPGLGHCLAAHTAPDQATFGREWRLAYAKTMAAKATSR